MMKLDDGLGVTFRSAQPAATDDATALYARVSALLPRISELAPAMQKAGRLDDGLMADLAATGAFDVFISKRWGGPGFGVREAGEVLRLLAQADMSVSWNASIYFAVSMFIQRFPIATQEEVFANGPSLRSPGVLAPAGTATRVAGGVSLSGSWPYASGVQHANFVMLSSMLDGAPHWFLMRRDQIGLLDDWDMAGLAASGSATVVLDDLFIPEGWFMPFMACLLPFGHGGNALPEAIHSYPHGYVTVMNAAMPLGVLQSAVANARASLDTSRPYGTARIDRPGSRLCWAQAAQKLRLFELSYEDLICQAIRRGEEGIAVSIESQGTTLMASLEILHGTNEVLRSLLDHMGGSSAYKNSGLLQRQVRDVGAMSTHLLLGDYHVIAERASRWMLGMRIDSDPLPVKWSGDSE